MGGRAVKAVIFDVDGTLVDSVDLHAEAWRQALKQFGHEASFEEVRSQIGKGSDQLMPHFLSEEEFKAKGEALDQFRTELFRRSFLPKVKGFPQVRPLVQRILDDGLQVALASSAKGEELDIYKERAGISDLIDTQTSSDDAERSKPYPDIFQAALARLKDVSPSDARVIGDTPYDAIAAGRAGVPCIGVLCGGFPEAELKKAGCRWIFRDPADLLARYNDGPLHA